MPVIIFTPCKFFTSTLSDGLSVEFSSFQDSSQYSGWSPLYYSLDGLSLSSDLRLFLSSFKPLENVLSAPIIIGVTTTFMFLGFPSSWARSRYSSVFLISLIFTLWSAGMAKSIIWQVLFLLIIIRSDLLTGIKWSACISKSQRILCLLFFRMNFGLRRNHLISIISISCTITSGSPSLPSYVLSYIPFALVCYFAFDVIVLSLSPHKLQSLLLFLIIIMIIIIMLTHTFFHLLLLVDLFYSASVCYLYDNKDLCI